MPGLSCPFVWYDVMTTDPAAAATFYERVAGWKATDATMSPDRPYTLFSAGSAMVAGLMPTPPSALERGVPPAWMGYIAVPDVDLFAERVTAAGGKILRGPEEIPVIGRFAVAADPHGAPFILFKSASMPPPPAPMATGSIGWHELHSGNAEKAFAFYSGLFGWSKVDAMDMGPAGTYQTFATGNEAPGMTASGGMMTKAAAIPFPFWLYYIAIENIDAAASRVAEAGGKVTHGPHEVPGGMWIVQATDPQGAAFALVGPKT